MDPQLFVGKQPSPDSILPIENVAFRHKPKGGLWTSTHLGNLESGWTKWCEAEEWSPHTAEEWDSRWLLTVSPDVNVYEICDYQDLETLLCNYAQPVNREYNYRPTAIDFEKMEMDGYDGLHLTEEGQWATRLARPHDLYGWDCESTIWFNWCFLKVERG